MIEELQNKAIVRGRLAVLRTNGRVDHSKTLSIPDNERIPALIKSGRAKVLTAITAALTSAFLNMNLRVSMNEEQIIDLADAIIDESHEDQLSIEDVLLFLRDMITGKMGKIYDRMDMPTFFEMFEKYRQERYATLKRWKEERIINEKALGIKERASDDYNVEVDLHRTALSEHLKSIYKDHE